MRRIFTDGQIEVIRHKAAQGLTGIEIALALDRSPQAVRRKCVELGISLRDTRKKHWHRLRVLMEPQVHKALTLAARRRGSRAGDLARRLLTAVLGARPDRHYFDHDEP